MGALFCFNTAYGQSGPEIETITINPHEDVRIVFEQLKEKNFKHGKYTYYHRNIKIVEGNYLAGKKHGKWQRFFQDGTISIDAFYLQDKKHGNWIYYFKDKTKMASVFFNRGKRKGEWNSWYHGYGIQAKLNYLNDNLVDTQEVYYHPKSLKLGAQPPHLQLKMNIKEGVSENGYNGFERYYPNGKLFEKGSESNGEKVGMYESFYYTTLPWKKMKYEEDGRLFSIYEYNNPVGKDANKGTFWDGNGELYSYNSNGDKFSRVKYSNGQKDGKIIIYEEDSKELITGYYDNNIPVGTWSQYKAVTSKKELAVEMHYTGIDTASGVFYLKSLQARDAGTVIKRKKNGIWRSYFANDHLKEISNFKMDFHHGTIKRMNESDQVDYTGSYFYGLKVGEWKYYNDFGKVIFREKFNAQVSGDEKYLFSDSCEQRPFMESVFYNTAKYSTTREKQLTFVVADEKHMNFDHFLNEGKYSSWPNKWKKDEPFVEEYQEEFVPEFPQFIPWEIEKRAGVVNDNDIGLFLETLNPRKLRVKGDKNSPKIGVAMVVVEIDEFGFVQRARIVRGIDPIWDQKILNLFKDFNFWEPGLLLNQPIATALQIKIPIDLEVVKKMD